MRGGVSEEREISLASGRAVAQGLRQAGYEVEEVDVRGRAVVLGDGVEAVFVALHGEYGEDGGAQAELERRGVPYTGSGPEASRAAFDKRISKRVFVENGIPTPEHEILGRGGRRSLPLPVVVKPACQGSSIGVHAVRGEPEWEPAFSDSLSYGPEVIVERYVPGRELTVGVVGDAALPVVEIVAPQGWYGFDAKYTGGVTSYLVPAPLEPAVEAKCRDLGLRAFRALGCEGLGRVDMRLSPGGDIYVLELNSIPGFTQTSLLPKAAARAGIGFSELCDRIMGTASVKRGGGVRRCGVTTT
jgi:D-alanine-D-alanine ligase